jgi:hypothetical protein
MAIKLNTELVNWATPDLWVNLWESFFKVWWNPIVNKSVVTQQKPADITSQAKYMQNTYWSMTMTDAYNALLKSKPTNTDLYMEIGKNTWLLQQMEGTRQQMMEIQKTMLWDQSPIFNATAPDWTPIDPRVKVAQFQANMNWYMTRLSQLQDMEATYKAELKTLTNAQMEKINAETEKNKLALMYLKDIEDKELQAKEFWFKEKQFQESKRQFDTQMEQRKYEFWQEMNKPEKVVDPITWETTFVSPTSFSWKEWMRTDRNNNPAAFTVDIAKQAWLVEWVDYEVWDKFPWNSKLYTAKLLWDPIETTIKVIDKIWFKTKSGQNRWTYTDKIWLTNEKWAKMDSQQKENAVAKMYQQEGGSWKLVEKTNETMPKDIALALDKDDLLAMKNLSEAEKKEIIENELLPLYKKDPTYFKKLRTININEYLASTDYTVEEKKNILQTALTKWYSILDVEKKFPWNKKEWPITISNYLKSLDTSKVSTQEDIDKLVDKVAKEYPDKKYEDIYAMVENVLWTDILNKVERNIKDNDWIPFN